MPYQQYGSAGNFACDTALTIALDKIRRSAGHSIQPGEVHGELLHRCGKGSDRVLDKQTPRHVHLAPPSRERALERGSVGTNATTRYVLRSRRAPPCGMHTRVQFIAQIHANAC